MRHLKGRGGTGSSWKRSAKISPRRPCPPAIWPSSMVRTGAISTSSPRTSPAWSGSLARRRKRCPFRCAIERLRLGEVAPIILPTEAIGKLGLEVLARLPRPPDAVRIWAWTLHSQSSGPNSSSAVTAMSGSYPRERTAGDKAGADRRAGILNGAEGDRSSRPLAGLQLSRHGDHRGLRYQSRSQPCPIAHC